MILDAYDLTVAIPAYGRVTEFANLLDSVIKQSRMPRELLVCEDNSPERIEIRRLCDQWKPIFEERGCILKYVENPINLGYDGNVRSLFLEATSTWVMLIGNDDLLLPECVNIIAEYIVMNPETLCASRTFMRFENNSDEFIGTSKIFSEDVLIKAPLYSSKYIFRSCGFVGGLLFSRAWALSKSTTKFDGSLYYQMYLACEAYCSHGIGYISTPTVAGRAGNTPLFGSASAEKSVHIPGSYTPKGRAKMWESVIDIFKEIGNIYSIDLVTDIRKEISGRQAFHVFEMLVVADRSMNSEMKSELIKLNLFSGFIPNFLFYVNYIFGHHAKFFYSTLRRIAQ